MLQGKHIGKHSLSLPFVEMVVDHGSQQRHGLISNLHVTHRVISPGCVADIGQTTLDSLDQHITHRLRKVYHRLVGLSHADAHEEVVTFRLYHRKVLRPLQAPHHQGLYLRELRERNLVSLSAL
ncbi:hypothetical protein BACCAP_03182 [Pseudoflavonifractor capillosus ATCC 29799]|uniref:Uncharacterized protein n=1 Tax=Pseudoflavonifractor capillosus ATCC 29799 TaxID=411467 RepID=A6NY84_9FIRM|nr:hypothetical protein BACCAP_03182 [Pseudoflavonifractor capillosus ATCC 29799]